MLVYTNCLMGTLGAHLIEICYCFCPVLAVGGKEMSAAPLNETPFSDLAPIEVGAGQKSHISIK